MSEHKFSATVNDILKENDHLTDCINRAFREIQETEEVKLDLKPLISSKNYMKMKMQKK